MVIAIDKLGRKGLPPKTGLGNGINPRKGRIRMPREGRLLLAREMRRREFERGKAAAEKTGDKGEEWMSRVRELQRENGFVRL
jgi:hypothetical protein